MSNAFVFSVFLSMISVFAFAEGGGVHGGDPKVIDVLKSARALCNSSLGSSDLYKPYFKNCDSLVDNLEKRTSDQVGGIGFIKGPLDCRTQFSKSACYNEAGPDISFDKAEWKAMSPRQKTRTVAIEIGGLLKIRSRYAFAEVVDSLLNDQGEFSNSPAKGYETEEQWYQYRIIELNQALEALEMPLKSCPFYNGWYDRYDDDQVATPCSQNYFRQAAKSVSNATFVYGYLNETKSYLETINLQKEQNDAFQGNPNFVNNLNKQLYISLKSGPESQIQIAIKSMQDHLKGQNKLEVTRLK